MDGRMITVIFSKDRSLQLDATLRSLYLNCDEYLDIHVLYTCSNERHENSYKNLEKKQAQVKESKPLPVWTGRRVTILKPESQAIKDCILKLGVKGEWFTRSDAKEAAKAVLSSMDGIDSIIHSQLSVLQKHGIIKKVGEGRSKLGTTGKKKINYYALC